MSATESDSPAGQQGSTRPLVSVIIPAYNARDFVLDAVNSVLAQDYRPLEVVLVDDGSDDGTADLVRDQAPAVRVIRQSNAGAAAARNRGLNEASGELICFLDADDGWFPGKLKAQVAHLLANPDVGLVYHQWLVWHPDADGVHRLPEAPPVPTAAPVVAAESGWIYHRLLLDCLLHTSTVMIRRVIAEQVGGFDTELQVGEDYDYWLRASRLCRIDKLDAVYSFYRGDVSGSLTHSPKPINYEYQVVTGALARWGDQAPDGARLPPGMLRRRLAGLQYGFGCAHLRRGSASIARRAFAASLGHQPLNWRAGIYLGIAAMRAWLDR